jgi:ribosomal protein S18 acetylase RimI-like enzyme
MSSSPPETGNTRDVGAAVHGLDIVVRLALPVELDAAGEVVRAAYAADGVGHDSYHRVLADARDRSRDADLAVAVDPDGTVLGCVTFALPGSRWAELSRPGEAEFRMLGVAPAGRGRGIGTALVRWCLDRARADGAHRLVICSESSMLAAHRIYTRIGFVRRPDLDWSPIEDVQLIGFALELT